ncbi:MAG: response regulator [Planctomycetaceae bacterium]|nr:response regulator [Planctomycetaceae bacterium]
MILIVDDEPGVSAAFSRVLTASHIPHHAVGSLADARQVLSQGGWTGFILDIFLPDGTGVEYLAEIRARAEHQHTPVAVITADILLDDQMVEQLRHLGARLYCGAFGRADIERICVALLMGRQTPP